MYYTHCIIILQGLISQLSCFKPVGTVHVQQQCEGLGRVSEARRPFQTGELGVRRWGYTQYTYIAYIILINTGNPLEEKHSAEMDWRDLVIKRLPKLKKLDG